MAEKGGIWRTAQLSLFLYSTDFSEGVLFRNRLNLYTYQPVKKLLTVPLSQWAATQNICSSSNVQCLQRRRGTTVTPTRLHILSFTTELFWSFWFSQALLKGICCEYLWLLLIHLPILTAFYLQPCCWQLFFLEY